MSLGQVWLRVCKYFAACFLLLISVGGYGIDEQIRLRRVVVFGDSLADTGNTWKLTRYLNGIGDKPWFYDELFSNGWRWLPMGRIVGIAPPSGYYHGRFSNGPLAGELLIGMMGMDTNDPEVMQNLAFGGSWTVSSRRFLSSWASMTWDSTVSTPEWIRHLVGGHAKWLLPSATEIVDWYLRRNPALDDKTMYILESGANDYQNLYWDVDTLVDEQASIVRRLIEAGARHISWGTLPNLTATPCFKGSKNIERVLGLVRQHNQQAIDAKNALALEFPEVKITFIDGYTAMQLFFDNADSFGFKVKDQGCTNINIPGCPLEGGVSIQKGDGMTVCSNPDEYFFWDSMHPTTRAYEYVATYMCVVAGLEGYWTDCRLPKGFNLNMMDKLYELMTEDERISALPDLSEVEKLLQIDKL